MSAVTLTTTPVKPHAGRRDWYAVSIPPRAPRDARRTFTRLAIAMAAPVPADREHVEAALAILASAAAIPHLVPAPSDPDVVVHRLAARILARFMDEPDHPAVRAAARRLDA